MDLPLEYFNEEENDLSKENLNDKDLLSVDNIAPLQQKEEEQQPVESNINELGETTNTPAASNSFNGDNQEQKLLKTEIKNNNQEEIKIRPELNQDLILEEISNVDAKISDLEQQIKNIDLQEKKNFNNYTQNYNSTFNNFDEGDVDESSDVVEVYSSQNNLQKQYIKRDLNLLKEQKNKLLKKQEQFINNITQKDKTPILNEGGFVPNLSNNEVSDFLQGNSNDSLDNALEVESFLEGPNNVKVVGDDKLGTAVINKSQGNLQNAVAEHGGIDKAIKDSVNNQSNFTQINSSLNDLPDNNNAIAGDTKRILEGINNITSKLSDILSAIKSNNANLNNSRQETTYTSERASTEPSSTKNKPTSSSRPPQQKSTIPDSKSNLPLASDFPAGYNLEELGGSNLLMRT